MTSLKYLFPAPKKSRPTEPKQTMNEEIRIESPAIPVVHFDSGRIRYRNIYFMQITLGLLTLSLVPIQFHADRLNLQMIKVKDDCFLAQNTTRQVFLTETERLLTDTNDSIINPNTTIQYLNSEECRLYKNRTNLFDVFELKNGDRENAPAVFNFSNIYLCIDDISKHFILNETFLKDMLLNSYNTFTQQLTFRPELSVLPKWNITTCNDHAIAVAANSVAHVRVTDLAGRIVGSISMAILADQFGRKKMLLISIFLSTIFSFLFLAFHSFKQYLVLSMAISALIQSTFVTSYVLLFELILDRQKQNFYCSLFMSISYLVSVVMGIPFRLAQNWQNSHLTDSLLALVTFGCFPWLILESYRWQLNKNQVKNAERTARFIFKDDDILCRLLSNTQNVKTNKKTSGVVELAASSGSGEANGNSFGSLSYAMFMWRITFKKIVCFLIFIWSLTSFVSFFVDENDTDQNYRPLNLKIDYFLIENLVVGVCNISMSFMFLRIGKRLSLGSCIFLGGWFHLASILFSRNVKFQMAQLLFYLGARVLTSFALNVLLIFTCELFPCEIRCTSFSFMLSIRHLSEMFAIYVFKIHLCSTFVVKLTLPVLCIFACVVSFLLPEHVENISLNLDFLGNLNKDNILLMLRQQLTPPKPLPQPLPTATVLLDRPKELVLNVNNSMLIDRRIRMSGMERPQPFNPYQQQQPYHFHHPVGLGNDIVNVINAKNFARHGKLNPLYTGGGTDDERT